MCGQDRSSYRSLTCSTVRDPAEISLPDRPGALGLGDYWTTAMPYGLLPVGTVAATWRVVGSMTDSVFVPWLAT
jgi:hypothetical protein